MLDAMRLSNQSESGSFLHQASLKGHEGPALVVFSGGTAFNSVAGVLHAWLLECWRRGHIPCPMLWPAYSECGLDMSSPAEEESGGDLSMTGWQVVHKECSAETYSLTGRISTRVCCPQGICDSSQPG